VSTNTLSLHDALPIYLEGRKILSVVGTRNITNYGMSFCESFIEEIAPLDPIIVSGFAYGVNICIQKAAVKHGLQTIGCLAHGLKSEEHTSELQSRETL